MMVSFSHVRRDANKAADLLSNACMEGALGFHCDTLEEFGAKEWSHHCRQVASRDLDSRLQVARPDDGSTDGDRRREHA